MESLKAGRELDAEIAMRVMGWDSLKTTDLEGLVGMSPEMLEPDAFSVYVKVPHYSTSIADAWEVVEKMREHLDITISANQNTCEVRSRDFPDQIIACEQGDTIPHAICLASLKAVGNGKTNT